MTLTISSRLAAIPHYEPGLTTTEVLARYGLDAAIKLASNESPYRRLTRCRKSCVRARWAQPLSGRRCVGPAPRDRRPARNRPGSGCDRQRFMRPAAAGRASAARSGTTLIHPEPSFSLYSHLAAAAGADAIAVPLDEHGRNDLAAMAAAIDERTRLVILCSPTIPRGLRAGVGDRGVSGRGSGRPADPARRAYYDFVTEADRGRALSQARDRPNLLLLRTFSKAHGLCGLRVGYGMGSADWIAAIDRVRQPFNTSSLGQVAALESLRHLAALERRVQETVSERARVAEGLAKMGVRFTPSQANFILVTPDAGEDGSRAAARGGGYRPRRRRLGMSWRVPRIAWHTDRERCVSYCARQGPRRTASV